MKARTRTGLPNRLLLCLALVLPTACTEDTLTGIDPDTAPGSANETIEIFLSSVDLPLWRDTTYSGYALPSTSGLLVVADSPDLRARVLGRFSTLPDSLTFEEAQVAVERFEAARLRVVIDTAASVVSDSGARISLYALGRDFADREASWSEARAGEPWTSPGGDLGDLLGTLSIDSLNADTVFLALTGDADSLLTAWRAVDGEPGFALVTETAGSSLALDQVALAFDVKPVGIDTLLPVLRVPAPSTFIFDPETPGPGGTLRLGGLPASRAYLSFRLPDVVDGVQLRGARINRATLLFTSKGPPPAPFATTDTLLASAFSLLTDPFEFGPKTPVGFNFTNTIQIVPEDMQDGDELDVDVTALLQVWSVADPDSVPELNVGFRALPEGGSLGFWELSDVDDPGREPRVRILLTPTTAFDLP